VVLLRYALSSRFELSRPDIPAIPVAELPTDAR